MLQWMNDVTDKVNNMSSTLSSGLRLLLANVEATQENERKLKLLRELCQIQMELIDDLNTRLEQLEND